MRRRECAIDILEEVRYQMKSDLDRYRSSPKAIETYVVQKEQLLTRLEEALYILRSIKYFSCWQRIDHEAQELIAQKPNLTGHRIFLKIRPGKEDFSLIVHDISKKRRRFP